MAVYKTKNPSLIGHEECSELKRFNVTDMSGRAEWNRPTADASPSCRAPQSLRNERRCADAPASGGHQIQEKAAHQGRWAIQCQTQFWHPVSAGEQVAAGASRCHSGCDSYFFHLILYAILQLDCRSEDRFSSLNLINTFSVFSESTINGSKELNLTNCCLFLYFLFSILYFVFYICNSWKSLNLENEGKMVDSLSLNLVIVILLINSIVCNFFISVNYYCYYLLSLPHNFWWFLSLCCVILYFNS